MTAIFDIQNRKVTIHVNVKRSQLKIDLVKKLLPAYQHQMMLVDIWQAKIKKARWGGCIITRIRLYTILVT